MTSGPSFLTALRLSDSFLPVGSHTASYGLEQYINEGAIETAAELGSVIEGYLRGVVAPAEMVALGNAHAAAAERDLEAVLAADERLHAATLPAEFRESSTKAGTGLLELLSDTDAGFGLPTTDGGAAGVGVPDAYSAADTADDGITTDDGITADYGAVVESGETPGHHAVALGVVCQASGIDREAACQVLAYTVVTDLLGAAQRLGRFGHTEIQTILSEQLPVIDELSTEYADADLAALGSFAPLADVMGMAHERADRRLFVS